MDKPEEQTVRSLTFALVDTPSDVWLWCIVTDYEGSQDYGEIVCAFHDEYIPSARVVEILLQSLA